MDESRRFAGGAPLCRHIVPFIQKFGVNPVTGAPLSLKQLTTLHFHKNDKGAHAAQRRGTGRSAHS